MIGVENKSANKCTKLKYGIVGFNVPLDIL